MGQTVTETKNLQEVPVIQVRNLTTKILVEKRPLTVVDSVSFDLHAGKTLALVGESGCGKSMTALSLLRILPSPPALPPEGEVVYQGKNLLKVSEREMRSIRGKSIGMIFQDPMSALNPVFSIEWQLVEVAHLHLGLTGDAAKAKAVEALHDVGIPSPHERMKCYPHQLSGGMKQRVMIAMALMCEPDVLIADEPTTALDVTVQAQVLDLMRTLQEKRGMAILLITHDMGVVAEMADEVIVMYASHAVEWGDVQTIFDAPAHPYTKGLFAARPKLHGKKGELEAIPGMVPPVGSFPPGCHFHPRCPSAMACCKEGPIATHSLPKGQKVACKLYEKNS